MVYGQEAEDGSLSVRCGKDSFLKLFKGIAFIDDLAVPLSM